MSWGTNWSDDSGFSYNYYTQAASEQYIVLDPNEALVGTELYAEVELTPNVACTFTVNGEPTDTIIDNGVALLQNIQHTIVATPVNASAVKESSMTKTIIPTNQFETLAFEFTLVNPTPNPNPNPDPNPTPTPSKNWIELLVEDSGSYLEIPYKYHLNFF